MGHRTWASLAMGRVSARPAIMGHSLCMRAQVEARGHPPQALFRSGRLGGLILKENYGAGRSAGSTRTSCDSQLALGNEPRAKTVYTVPRWDPVEPLPTRTDE